jgi:hypothetical protein
MLLSAIEIRHFRSLEDVRIDGLSTFNVFIGRNNTGKSSFILAMQILAEYAFLPPMAVAEGRSLDRLATNHDYSIPIEYRLEFATEDSYRVRFIDEMIRKGYNRDLREQLLQSPFLRSYAYDFRSELGSINQFELIKIEVLDVLGDWGAPLLRDEQNNPIVNNFEGSIKNSPRLDASVFQPKSMTSFPPQSPPKLGRDLLSSWRLDDLEDYFRSAYFFDAHRHGTGRSPAQHRDTLAANGSDLPAVLNTLAGLDRAKLDDIQNYLHGIIPNVGTLHSGPVLGPGTQVEILFEADSGRRSKLPEVGGGIEQLLLVATALKTTNDQASLFLEEPELYLHAGAQRYLIDTLRREARQVFIATHSPVFVNVPGTRTIYRTELIGSATTFTNVSNGEGLSEVLDDLGYRNSDLLFSDAVLFVEGPSDRDVITVLAATLGLNLLELNIAILPIGGASNSAQMPARSDVLKKISAESPVPHVFLMDRDERSKSDIDRLKSEVGEQLHVLHRREIENYLLVPRAIRETLRIRCQSNAESLRRLETTTEDQIASWIQQAAMGLKQQTLLKRVRNEVDGLPGGFLPRDMIPDLVSLPQNKQFPVAVSRAVRKRLLDSFNALQLETLVERETKRIETDWEKAASRLRCAPGEEILDFVYHQFEVRFRKTDSAKIAAQLKSSEIDRELSDFLRRLATLPHGAQ